MIANFLLCIIKNRNLDLDNKIEIYDAILSQPEHAEQLDEALLGAMKENILANNVKTGILYLKLRGCWKLCIIEWVIIKQMQRIIMCALIMRHVHRYISCLFKL